MAKLTDEQIASVFAIALDRQWGGEKYSDGEGGGLHQVARFEAVVEGNTLILGADGQGFYDVPLSIKALREGFFALGIEI